MLIRPKSTHARPKQKKNSKNILLPKRRHCNDFVLRHLVIFIWIFVFRKKILTHFNGGNSHDEVVNFERTRVCDFSTATLCANLPNICFWFFFYKLNAETCPIKITWNKIAWLCFGNDFVTVQHKKWCWLSSSPCTVNPFDEQQPKMKL